MENPPLWVWGIIVGAVIAGKFMYRWQATKEFAKESKERKSISREEAKGINNDEFYNNIKNNKLQRDHKYSPRHYYKDYFEIKKKKK
jgi:hypothetical protein